MDETAVATHDSANEQAQATPTGIAYIFYKGPGNTKTILYRLFDGQNFGPEQTIPNTATSDSPWAVLLNGKIYCLHQSSGTDGALWYNVFNGLTWAGDLQVPNTRLTAWPSAAVVQNNSIFCYYQSYPYGDELYRLHRNTFDGSNWWGDDRVPNTGLISGPATVAYGPGVFTFYQAGPRWGELWYTTYVQGTGYLPNQAVPGSTLAAGPAAVIYNSKIYVFYQNAGTGSLRYNVLSGQTWSGEQNVPNAFVSSQPSAMVLNGMIYCFYAHNEAVGAATLRFMAFDGTNWSGENVAAGTTLTGGPAPLAVHLT